MQEVCTPKKLLVGSFNSPASVCFKQGHTQMFSRDIASARRHPNILLQNARSCKRLPMMGRCGLQLSTLLKPASMFNHNGTYLKGIGFKYRNVEVVVEAGPDFDTALTGKGPLISSGHLLQGYAWPGSIASKPCKCHTLFNCRHKCRRRSVFTRSTLVGGLMHKSTSI